jgi:Holliday junction resolvase RusA-like endonuclease
VRFFATSIIRTVKSIGCWRRNMRIEFTIPLPPITKKNHQQIVNNPKTGKPFVIPSRQYKEYEKSAMWFIPRPQKPIDIPVNVKCLFYLPTKRKGDLTNYLEAIDDVMVKVGLLEDDNYTIIQSHDGSRVLYDKANPRTEIIIEEVM